MKMSKCDCHEKIGGHSFCMECGIIIESESMWCSICEEKIEKIIKENLANFGIEIVGEPEDET